VFVDKFDLIFSDVEFPHRITADKLAKARQDSVQFLAKKNKFIFWRVSNSKTLRHPFWSDYIQRSLYYLILKPNPRFPGLLKNSHITVNTIAVVCTFVSHFT
jgi:hypothetical protein